MNYEEIAQMNNKELHFTLKDERKNLQRLKFNHAVSPIDNPAKIRNTRRTIARLLTEINKRKSGSC
jgi:large subunit ribosomal protein L29